MSNRIFVLSGPSGVGKGTIGKAILEKYGMFFSVSCTTRVPRTGEVDGVHYFFISKDAFIKKVNNNGFLEYSSHFDNYYGTPSDVVLKKLEKQSVLLDIDVDGALAVKKKIPSAVLIMILPPTKESLLDRLKGRNTETEDTINKRLSRYDYEISKQYNYDYVVTNDDLDKCIKDIFAIIDENIKEN